MKLVKMTRIPAVARPMNSAQKRYLARFFPTMAAYVGLLFLVDWLFRGHRVPPGAVSYLVAAAPAVPLVGVIVAMGLYLREEPDEFQRAVLAQAMLLATGVALAVTTVWGFLEEYGGAPHMPTYWCFIIWCAAFGPAQPLIKWWRYR